MSGQDELGTLLLGGSQEHAPAVEDQDEGAVLDQVVEADGLALGRVEGHVGKGVALLGRTLHDVRLGEVLGALDEGVLALL